tara:strand:+ start:879 stop:1328 length:450 start_codon:yes stop_codon:yes gene_type:complete
VIKVLIIIFLVVIDIISKQAVYNYIDLNNFLTVTYFLDIAHIHNYGIAFGLFAGLVPYWTITIISLIVSGFILYMFIISNNKNEKLGLLLILAGAISNISDRTVNGYVVDFIYMHYNNYYWPAFNLADIYISLGVFILVLQILKDFNKR